MAPLLVIGKMRLLYIFSFAYSKIIQHRYCYRSYENSKTCLTVYSLNEKKILAVINATYAVAKRKPEKIRLAGIRTLTSAIPVQRSKRSFRKRSLSVLFATA